MLAFFAILIAEAEENEAYKTKPQQDKPGIANARQGEKPGKVTIGSGHSVACKPKSCEPILEEQATKAPTGY